MIRMRLLLLLLSDRTTAVLHQTSSFSTFQTLLPMLLHLEMVNSNSNNNNNNNNSYFCHHHYKPFNSPMERQACHLQIYYLWLLQATHLLQGQPILPRCWWDRRWEVFTKLLATTLFSNRLKMVQAALGLVRHVIQVISPVKATHRRVLLKNWTKWAAVPIQTTNNNTLHRILQRRILCAVQVCNWLIEKNPVKMSTVFFVQVATLALHPLVGAIEQLLLRNSWPNLKLPFKNRTTPTFIVVKSWQE